MSLVYVLWNKDNNKPYVGKTTRNLEIRLKQHNGEVQQRSKTCFHNALRKYGLDKFKTQTVRCPSDEKWALDWLENVLIEDLDAIRPMGYNIKPGGSGGSEKGRILTEEHKRKIGQANKGRKRPDVAGKNNPYYGKFGSKHPKAKAIILIHPDGTEEYFGSQIDACKKYDLHTGSITTVAKGRRKHTKGFRAYYVEKK